jgi:asparagine synthase (glutamine-hydrolysing)
MRDRLAHRGPDGAGSWIGRVGSGSVGLAHRRLSIIDLSDAAQQPMASTDGSFRLVYNGEIYNYLELRAELVRLGAVFRTRSDTEVLLAAYERWGTDCLARLNGMFAFALWDEHKRRLFVARDRFGEKPLFLARLSQGGVALASEIKALFAHPDVHADPHEPTVTLYAAGAYYEDGEPTMFAGVTRLPPAHALLLDASGAEVKRWRYWTPDYTAIRIDYEEADAAETLRELLRNSIRLRLRSDVPIGTSLSGGLDSSAIVCLLNTINRAEQGEFSQNSFSARFEDDPTMSEGPEIDRVVMATRVTPHSVSPDPNRLAEESQRLHWHQEEPFLSASIYLQWCVSRLARESGVTVLIDGQGADELLGGYQFYFRSFQLDCIDRRDLIALLVNTYLFASRLRSASRRFVDSRRRFNDRIAASASELIGYWRAPPAVWAGPYSAGVPPAAPGWRLRRQMAEALQYNCLPTLLRYADRNSMAFGREVRLPFLDHELVDWCVGLPDRAFVHQGWQKYILRRAGEGVIPAEIQWRADKVGYAAPLDRWLRGPLKQWAYDRLFAGPVTELDAYDRQELTATWERHQSQQAEHSWALWRWISLSEWLCLGRSGAWKHGIGA